VKPLQFAEARDMLKDKGFFLIQHRVVIHHMLKDFADYDVTRSRFYILPVGVDFIHVALIEYDTGRLISWEPYIPHPQSHALQVRYTLAGDDLLYGLRTKYTSGGSDIPDDDLKDIFHFIQGVEDKSTKNYAFEAIRNHPRYIRKRFRHGRAKAKLRAAIVMLKDKWRELWP
jgi:hypothetical protein